MNRRPPGTTLTYTLVPYTTLFRSHGLQDGSGVDGALGGTGTHEGVELVDEQDDVAAGADLLEHLLEALLEVAAVAGAGHERTEVERVELLVLQRLGDVVGDDLLGQALDDPRLAAPGPPAQQHGQRSCGA